MPILQLLPILGGAALAATPAPLPNGWEVHEADRFCYVWLGAPERGGTEFALALDSGAKATVILTNAAWHLQADRSYRLATDIGGSSKRLKARGLKLMADKVSLVADIDEPGFLDRFAASPSFRFEVDKPKTGAGQGSFDLAGAAVATEALRSCQERLKIRVLALDKQRMDRETNFRTDPVAQEEARAAGDPER